MLSWQAFYQLSYLYNSSNTLFLCLKIPSQCDTAEHKHTKETSHQHSSLKGECQSLLRPISICPLPLLNVLKPNALPHTRQSKTW